MNVKIILGLFLVLLSVSSVSAEMVWNDNRTIAYLIGNVDEKIKVYHEPLIPKYEYNPYVLECVNSTCVKGWFKIYLKEFDFTYEFIYEGDDGTVTKNVQIISHKITDGLITDIYTRTLKIDGIVISEQDVESVLFISLFNPVYFYYNNENGNIKFDKETFDIRLFFTTLKMDDQYNYFTGDIKTSDSLFFYVYTLSDSGSITRLSGLTGIFYNVLDDIPFIGKSLQSIVFFPLFIIQILFNFSFTFLSLIINDWWYALMLLEIMCIIPVLKHKKYADLVKGYIHNHIIIILFVKDKVMIPMINLIITIIVVIRNMFRI